MLKKDRLAYQESGNISDVPTVQVLPDRHHPDFQKALKLARVSLGLTQDELSEKLGVRRHTVGRWENKNNQMGMHRGTWNHLCSTLVRLGFKGMDYKTSSDTTITEMSVEDCIARLKELGAKEVVVSF